MKAMILAAGFGKRLGTITETVPKCLVDIGGTTPLEHVVVELKKAGVTGLVINLHHLGEKIRAFVLEKKSFGLSVEYSEEPIILGTGGGIKAARRFLENESEFIVHNGDIYSEINLKELLETHQRERPVATLAVMKRETSRPLLFSGIGELRGWKSPKAQKISSDSEGLHALAFSGVQVVSPGIFPCMDSYEGEFSSI